MGKHRIYEIAKELGKSNQEVIDVLAKNNIQVKSLSTVDDAAKEMVVRAFAKKPVQPEKKPAPQQQKAQNNAPKAVPAKNDANKASAQKQVKVQVQNQPKPVEKNKPQQDNKPKNAGNKPAPAHNEQRNQNQVKNNNQNNQNHKKNNQPMQQHGKGNLQQGQQGKNNKQNRPQRPQGGIFIGPKGQQSGQGSQQNRSAAGQQQSRFETQTRGSQQGGSTITQQLVKNLFLSSERSYWRKANEAYMALIMDARYSKDRILELYMNEVYLGQSGDNEIRGFPLASLYYFGRPVEELSLDQQALLVGMVKGASIYNPWRNPKLALERRNLVLRLLQQQQIIDQELYDMLSARPLGVQPRGGVISPQPAFMQLVRQELQAKLGDKVKDLSGVKIFTTFDSVAQDAAEKAAVEGIPALKKQRKLSDLETAIVVVDRFSGEVRAMVGGSEPQFAGYNRAMQARRSIGSLAKPATYLTALSQPKIYRLNTWIADAPIALRQPNGQVWSPQNDDRRYSESGRVMLVDALTRSMNVPTVNLGMALGLPAVTETWIKLGVPKDQLHPVPAMLLGALNLTPIEVAQAFQTIASGGNRAPLSALRSVIAEDGKVLYQSFPQAERAVPAQAAYLTLWTMQQVVQRGTGRQLGAKYPNLHLAGKTGTTNNNVDTWFAGIDGSTVTITWVGRDNNQPTKLYGASGAMSIYQRYLANQTPTPLNLVPPEDIADMGVDYDGNFVCSGGMRVLPVWTSDPQSLCQQSEMQQQPSGNPFDQSSQPQQQPQQQPAQQEQKDSDGVAGWIKDMFGSN